jgi:uncharacterized damage-inducible protein DinB
VTCKELLDYETDNTEYQLKACFEGLPVELREASLAETSMSPRQTLAHLAESYQALAAHLSGEKFEWGKFSSEGLDWENLKSTTFTLRSAALAKASDKVDDLKAVHDYVIAHDAYHVGQLCALRLANEPGWEAYSIYRF